MTQRLSFEKPTDATLPSCPRRTMGAALGSVGSQRRIVRSSLPVASHLLSGLNDAHRILPACPASSVGFETAEFFKSSNLSVPSQEPNATQRSSGLKVACRARSLNASSLINLGSEPALRSHSLPLPSMLAVAAQRESVLNVTTYTTSPWGPSTRGLSPGFGD